MDFFRRSRRAGCKLRQEDLSHIGFVEIDGAFVPPVHDGLAEGKPCSWTTWTEGVPMRLQRADVIGLTNHRRATMMRLWSEVEKVCGPFRTHPHFPPQLEPPTWPDEHAWKRLRTEFRPPDWAPDDNDL